MIGLYLEEIDIGRVTELGIVHFSKEAIVAFAQKYDPQPFHLDAVSYTHLTLPTNREV